MTARLVARILGCGSSGGVPRVGGDWGACDPAEPKNRRTRCSLLLSLYGASGGEPTTVLIDTSPDLREQLLAARVSRLDAVLLSHEHADQCHGIDDLRALVLRHRRRIPMHMDQATWDIVGRRFDYCFMDKPLYPAILEARVGLEAGQAVDIEGPGGALSIEPLTQDHGGGSSLGFRIGNFAYCNDVVRLPDESLKRLGGLDTLIVDALRTKPHPTHANVAQALAWIDALKPRRAVLTNMHVDLDYQTLRAGLPPSVEPAYDGMELETAIS
ncbi:MAG: MBL fold metallo-hydrolase [Alphaproteobacteria bacterium]|nr:MBL fold metallo-hydrolase [Alphaproteobacteria bacterium]